MSIKKKTTTTKKPQKAKKPQGTKKPTGEGTMGDREVVIRMYNVGFGDAFLVLIPDGDAHRRILFDCGSIEAAPDIAMKDVVERIISDVTDADGVPRIDVVVATHRHKDHVSGFGRADWKDVHVKEVWMPWTEHPTDPEARRIRETQSRMALALQNALAARAGILGPEEQRYQSIVANALTLTNDKEMKTLHSGFSGSPKRRFLPDETKEEDKRTFQTDALPGVRVHVMGPGRSEDVIRDMDPPKGESYLRMAGATSGNGGMPPAPFRSDFRHDAGPGGLSTQDMREIQRAGDLSDLAVAVALDKAVNGTSLMLMLDIAGTHLLFPGDAQWGTWDAALRDPEWRELLGKVAFYKIGHHGSHNATPIDFVEEIIPDGICAMASTLMRDIWPDIPRQPLLEALAAHKADIARSDEKDASAPRFEADEEGVTISARIPI